MPIRGIFWDDTARQDIHLLRGHSIDNLWHDRLFFSTATGVSSARAYFDDFFQTHHPPDVTLTFQPQFKGATNPAQNPPPPQTPHNVYSGQGITVDMQTGRITVAAPAPPLPKNNFIIEVTATNNAGGDPMREAICIHLHSSVTSVALTPATLTVRPSAATRTGPERTGYRFTVRAMFDDFTMGDITERHGVTWSSEPADHVRADGELVIQPGDVIDGPPITITATLPADLGGGSASGHLQVTRAWRDDPNLPEAAIVQGGGWPGTTLPEAAPNVMFLGDGFQDDDSDGFEHITNTMVQHLKTDRLMRPFDILCTSMNFWRTFVPASERGISVRCEVFVEDTGTMLAWPMEVPERPLADGDYTLGHLMYAVGLPVQSDAEKSVSDLRSDWDALVGPNPLPHGRIKDDLIEDWKLRATRGFIAELDNFPAMSWGEPPAARTLPDIPLLGLHSFRGGRDALNRLFGSMQSESNVQVGGGRIGVLWAGRSRRRDDTVYVLGDAVTVFANAALLFVCTTAGRSAAAEPADYATATEGATVADGTAEFRAIRVVFDSNPLVVVISSFRAGRAVNYHSFIAISTRTGTFPIPVQAQPMGFALDLDEDDVARDVGIDPCRTIAHEIGHSFGLGDEYIERPDKAYTGTQASLAEHLNLQTEADLQINNQIDATRIRWNWQRIRKAAVIRDTIEEAGTGGFKIPVVRGQAWQFAKDDTVLLRFRAPGQFLGSAYVNPRSNDTFYVLGDTVTVAANAQRRFVCTAAGTSAHAEPADYATATDGATVNDGAAAFRAIPAVNPALQIAVAPSASASDDFLLVQPAAGVNVTLAQLRAFAPGGIVFLPVPAPSSVRTAAYPYAEMVAKNVRDLIGRRHAPLFREPTGSDLQKEFDNPRDEQVPKVDGLAPQLPVVFCFSDKQKIVGLYEGGSLSNRGIFPPDGRLHDAE